MKLVISYAYKPNNDIHVLPVEWKSVEDLKIAFRDFFSNPSNRYKSFRLGEHIFDYGDCVCVDASGNHTLSLPDVNTLDSWFASNQINKSIQF